ncbi:hypothetical protein [Candidatus Magnetaquicoccus inordinatus]|uniref:hypothetical protein n=1 Tax=Candidatus Magnetaquicoccus inordinatus TaxID=2496818 RepID=UPI00102C86DC|nr:hypothetical protein [Candidatus Magnetaquicoccus inordinatus]
MVPLSLNKTKRMPPWTLAVANLALLLLIIFVGFLSVSRSDPNRSGMLVASIQRALGVKGAAAPQALGEAVDDPIGFPQKIALLHQITPLVDRRLAEVETTKEGFFMRMDLDTVFVPGTLLMRPEIRHRLRSMATLLASLENLLHVTGYIDSPAQPATSKKEGGKASAEGGTHSATSSARGGGTETGGNSRSAGTLALTTQLQQVSALSPPPSTPASATGAAPPAAESANATAGKGNDKSQAIALLNNNPALAHAVALAEFFVSEGNIPAWRIRTEGKAASATGSSDSKNNAPAESAAIKNTHLGQSKRIEIRIARETLSAEVSTPKQKTDAPAASKH